MIKQHYEQASRRALNIIWNAAGRYDFTPCFTAFHPNGQPDDYFNIIIGLTEKWLGLSGVTAFFSLFEGHARAEEFDEILWLGLENYVFERELPDRPVLKELRKKRGEEFFLVQQTLSEQQMALQSMPVYRQQQARWAYVTGRSLPLLSSKASKMMEALRFPGTLDPDEVIFCMRRILKDFFHYDPVSDPKEKRGLTGFRAWYRRFASRRQPGADVLLIRTGSGQGDPANAAALRREERKPALRSEKQDAEDLQYIRALFGPSGVTEDERKQAEAFLCTGPDDGCRLWISRGTGAEREMPGGSDRREIADTLRRMDHQKKRNERFLSERRLMIGESIRKLSSELGVLLDSFSRGLPELSRTGKLLTERAYRVSLLQDPFVFAREGEEREMHLRVELLLDASQSRMNAQEQIAAEAYIVARSLVNCHVPVSVTAFRSLRGYMVIQELKSADETDCSGITGYYASGWNRDGLALKTMRYLAAQKPGPAGEFRLLLVLTDASPNDTVRGSAFGKNYEGNAAVEDAADAVKKLRADGIRTAAVFHGSTSHLENLYRIYGKEYIRVQSLQQFSGSVVDLMRMALSEGFQLR